MSMAGLTGGGFGDKGLKLKLADTLKMAWADPDLRQRILFIFGVFAIFALGVNVPVPIPGVDPGRFEKAVQDSTVLQMMNMFAGGGLKRISIFALGLSPYITASIINQILTMTNPKAKKELQEGGEYARRKQNRNTRLLSVFLSFFQSMGFIQLFRSAGAITTLSTWDTFTICAFWTAGSMFVLWLGEQASERGIGNGVSLMIFAGICLSFPQVVSVISAAISNGTSNLLQVGVLVALFLATTWIIVLFTIAQRRIPIQHMRRNVGTKVVGGATSYLPLSINLAGVMPIIFAVSLIYLPRQFAGMIAGYPNLKWLHDGLNTLGTFLSPDFTTWKGWIAALTYTLLIFFFTYFYTALQYNVEDIADRLKKGGSFIPGVRPGKQTKDFLNAVISRITLVGAAFLSVIAIMQYVYPLVMPGVSAIGLVGGTSLLIMVSVALDTMRQIEASILMRQYGG